MWKPTNETYFNKIIKKEDSLSKRIRHRKKTKISKKQSTTEKFWFRLAIFNKMYPIVTLLIYDSQSYIDAKTADKTHNAILKLVVAPITVW